MLLHAVCALKITLIFLITLFIILLKFYEFSIVSSATLLLGIIWNWAMTVKGLLVKFVGPHQQTGQSSLSQKWSGGGIHRVPKAGGDYFRRLLLGLGGLP